MIVLVVIMLMYSAMKKSANLMPPYSVWNPATSSFSVSGRSKGLRLVSAKMQIKKNGNMAHSHSHSHQARCPSTRLTRLKPPASIRMLTRNMPIGNSYEIICAEERSAPSSE